MSEPSRDQRVIATATMLMREAGVRCDCGWPQLHGCHEHAPDCATEAAWDRAMNEADEGNPRVSTERTRHTQKAYAGCTAKSTRKQREDGADALQAEAEQTDTCGECGVYITNEHEIRVGLCRRCARDQERGERWE